MEKRRGPMVRMGQSGTENIRKGRRLSISQSQRDSERGRERETQGPGAGKPRQTHHV